MSDYQNTAPYRGDRYPPTRPRYERSERSFGDRTGGYSRGGYRSSFERRGGRGGGNWGRGDSYAGRDWYSGRGPRNSFPARFPHSNDTVRDGGIQKRVSSSRSSTRRSGAAGSKPGPASKTSTAERAARIAEESGPIFFCLPNDKLYGFMAPDFRSQFECDGWTYGSIESWMMANQADISGQQLLWQKLLQESSVSKQRILFEDIRSNPEDHKWMDAKSAILEEGLWLKSMRSVVSADINQLLLATQDRDLVYADAKSRDYGIGYDAKDAEANREKWGDNLLGKTLMKIRTQLQEQVQKATPAETTDKGTDSNVEYSPSSVQIEQSNDQVDDSIQEPTSQTEDSDQKGETFDVGDVPVEPIAAVDVQEEGKEENTSELSVKEPCEQRGNVDDDGEYDIEI